MLQRSPAIRLLVFERQPGGIQSQGLKHLTNRRRLFKNLTSMEVEVGLVQSSALSPAGQTLHSDMVTAVSASVFIPAVDICHNPHRLKQSRCAWDKSQHLCNQGTMFSSGSQQMSLYARIVVQSDPHKDVRTLASCRP